METVPEPQQNRRLNILQRPHRNTVESRRIDTIVSSRSGLVITSYLLESISSRIMRISHIVRHLISDAS